MGWWLGGCRRGGVALQSKKISNDQEPVQSDPTSCPQNLQNLLLWGWGGGGRVGGRLQNKNLAGGGVAEEMTGL